MKNMTHDEQNDLADAIAKAPWNDPDYLPVHKDVVAALDEWHRFWSEQGGPEGICADDLWREVNTNPLPKPPEPLRAG